MPGVEGRPYLERVFGSWGDQAWVCRLGDPALTTAVLQSGDPLDTVRAVGAVIATTFAASGVVTVIATRGRHLAWIVFLVIAALVFAAV